MKSRRSTTAKRPSVTSLFDFGTSGVPVRWEPEPYMRQACKFLVGRPEGILFLDPGLAKTAITLAALKALRRAGAVKKVLVVAPLRVCYQVWTHAEGGELAKWSDFNDLEEVLLHGGDKDEAVERDADLYVVNPDGLQWLTEPRKVGRRTMSHLDVLMAKGVDTLVIDELSKFRYLKTKRCKSIRPYLPKFRRRYGLTGSPAANGLLGLFGQAFTIDLGHALGRYITHYRFKYFMPTGYGGYKWVPKSDETEQEIYAAMKNLALAMKAEDHTDIPAVVEDNVWVDLPKKARKVYEQLEEEMFAMVDGQAVTAANAAVASVKCRQVASGGLYVGEGRDRKVAHVHDAKTEALVDLVDELQGSPLLVGYEFQHDLERIREALDVDVIGSGTSPKDTAAIAAKWNRGGTEVLCGHPQSMGHGLNLQAAGNHVAWYTTTWDYELYDQMVRRVRRKGNDAKKVFVHRLAARKTVDEVVLRAISSKRKGQDALFAALREYRTKKTS